MRVTEGWGPVLLSLLLATSTAALAGCVVDLPETLEPHLDLGPPPWPQGNVTLEVLDVGQGDAILVHTPEGALLVDTGGWQEEGHGPLLDHLTREGLEDITALVLTHPDADHVGGCDEVLERTRVTWVLHPGLAKDTASWTDCARAIEEEGATVRTDATLDPGDVLEILPGVRLTVLHLDASAHEPNDGSIVLRLDAGNASALLTGDVGYSVEDAMIARGLPLDVDLLKVAHHGSSTSTCALFLDRASPRYAVISVGGGNPYGHPHAEVLQRLESRGIPVLRTDLDGTVRFTTDGEGWTSLAPGPVDPTPSPAAPQGPRLGEVRYDAPGDDRENLDGEWATVIHHGNASVNLTGWTLEDDDGNAYVFPHGFHLAPNESVRVRTGHGNDTATDLHWGMDEPVWGNDGDVAQLRAPDGSLVDAVRW